MAQGMKLQWICDCAVRNDQTEDWQLAIAAVQRTEAIAIVGSLLRGNP
jgi:hypothetical protein